MIGLGDRVVSANDDVKLHPEEAQANCGPWLHTLGDEK